MTSSVRDRAVEIYENKILGRSTTLAALAKVNVISELDSPNAQKSVMKSNVRFTSLQCSQCSASLLNDVTGMNFCYKCGSKLKETKSSFKSLKANWRSRGEVTSTDYMIHRICFDGHFSSIKTLVEKLRRCFQALPHLIYIIKYIRSSVF